MLEVKYHNCIDSIGVLKITLIAEAPVHVGSGDLSIRENLPLSLNVKDANGTLIVPGSTLKGLTAHYYLAVYGRQEKTSSLFGFHGYMSRVLFKDAKPTTYVKPMYERVGASWRPRTRAPRSIKMYKLNLPRSNDKPVLVLECIPSGTELTTEIIVVNTRENELAEILLALGYTIGGTLLLGYGKPKGLGKVKVIEAEARIAIGAEIIMGVIKQVDLREHLEKLRKDYKSRLKEVFEVEL